MKTKEEIIKTNELKLKKELEIFEKKEQLLNIFPSVEPSVFDSFISYELETKGQIKDFLNSFKPTEENYKIGFAGKEDYVLESPYKIDLNNPASPNQWNGFKCSIHFKTSFGETWVKFPYEIIKDFTNVFHRNITSSEYHYFTGISQTKLYKMTVRCFVWPCDQISWYGGNKTCKSLSHINKVINFLKS